ncbi:unnamed protein product [Caretta caretta]
MVIGCGVKDNPLTWSNPPELGVDEIEELREAFAEFDKDKDGADRLQGPGHLMRSMGYMPTEMELIGLSQQINMNLGGRVDFEDCGAVDTQAAGRDCWDDWAAGDEGTPSRSEISDVVKEADINGAGDRGLEGVRRGRRCLRWQWTFAHPLEFWAWLKPETLALVTEEEVFHWALSREHAAGHHRWGAAGRPGRRFHVVELGPHQPGNAALLSARSSLAFKGAQPGTSPSAVQFAPQLGLALVLTKHALLFLADVETAQPLHRVQLAWDIVFATVPDPPGMASWGCAAAARCCRSRCA